MLVKKFVIKRVDPNCYALLTVTSNKESRLYSLLTGYSPYLIFKEYRLDELCHFSGFAVVRNNCELVDSFLCSEKFEQPQAGSVAFSYNPFTKLTRKSKIFKTQSEYFDYIDWIINNEGRSLTSEEADYLKSLKQKRISSEEWANGINPNFCATGNLA